MYLPSAGVRSLMTTLYARHPGAELVAEVANRSTVRMMQSRLGRGKFRRQFGLTEDVVYQFGLDDSRELESWAPGIAFLDDWTYFDESEPKLGWMRLFARWPLFRHAQWTVYYCNSTFMTVLQRYAEELRACDGKLMLVAVNQAIEAAKSWLDKA